VLKTTDASNNRIGVSREIIIKRVANMLGASHAAGTDDNNEKENRFDPFVRELHKFKVANGIPLTHYQLIEIAGVIISKFDKYLS